jgi:hypothetical protein
MKASIKTIITIAILYFIITLFSSCKKEEYILFVEEPEVVDTTSWQSTYNNGGTLTGNPSQTNNLVGTKWVLTKVVSAFSTEYPNDTITFITNNDYVLNQNAQRPYTLSSLPSSTNYELTLSYFMPFGGSHYSGNVGYYFVDDGEINNLEFTNIQNTSSTIRAWFTKIN